MMASLYREWTFADRGYDDCPFCYEFTYGNAPEVWSSHGVGRRVTWVSEVFAALPSLGPLIEGHFLVLPLHHTTAFAHLRPDQRLRAEVLVQFLADHLLGPSRTLVFEHGMRLGGVAGGCGISHAHLHMLPIPPEIDASPPGRDLDWLEVGATGWLSATAALSDSSPGYLLWGIAGSPLHAAPCSAMPSQFLRRRIASRLGVDNWDWRLNSDHAAFMTTLDMIESSKLAPLL